jgi:DNA-binding NtrC family response regulator
MERVLLLETEEAVRVLLSSILRESGFEVMTRSGRDDCLEILRDRPEDFSLFLVGLFGNDREEGDLSFVKAAKTCCPELPLVVLTENREESFHECLHRAGAVDIIERSAYTGKRMEISMKNILNLKEAVRENTRLQETVQELKTNLRYYREFFKSRYEPVGRSKAFVDVMKKAERLAFIPRPVLILGPRGAGKEIVAGAIHYMGDRAAGNFVTVNCASFHGELLASELFGHEKGAFTGAQRRRPGRFELADRGTLFLDEIGSMPLEFQEKILRIIEYQEFERLGGTDTLRVDVRVIAATNRDIQKLIGSGDFRADLYDRLAFEIIRVPPLKERREDIAPLVTHFMNRFVEEIPHMMAHSFSEEALEKLRQYSWPGNIRELRNVVERTLFRATKDRIAASDLPLEILPETTEGASLPEKVAAFERQLLLTALKECRFNQKKSAKQLGVSYDQFRHLYKKHHIKDMLEGE